MTSFPRRPPPRRHPHQVTDVYHHIECRHRVEVEVWPPRAEVNFRDERYANPATTQVRFEASVINSNNGVRWEVVDLAGNPGAGTIDAGGVYRAPDKGTLSNGATDIVVVSSREDPLRKAYAWVTLIGVGPEPPTAPTIQLWPKHAELYYPQGQHNAYIDKSNTQQLFQANLWNSATSEIEWLVNGVLQFNSAPFHQFRYEVVGSGGTKTVVIRARSKFQPSVYEEAKVLIMNYNWPGL